MINGEILIGTSKTSERAGEEETGIQRGRTDRWRAEGPRIHSDPETGTVWLPAHLAKCI